MIHQKEKRYIKTLMIEDKMSLRLQVSFGIHPELLQFYYKRLFNVINFLMITKN